MQDWKMGHDALRNVLPGEMWSKFIVKHFADVLLNGAPLRLCNTLKYIGITFDV